MIVTEDNDERICDCEDCAKLSPEEAKELKTLFLELVRWGKELIPSEEN